MKLLKTYIFKDYPIEVKTSNKKRGIYYINDEKLPIKFVKNIGIDLDLELKSFIVKGKKVKKEILVNMKTREPIFRNEKSREKGSTYPIKGQQLHSLTMLPHIRSIIVDTLKKYFISNIIEQGILLDNIDSLYLELIFNTDIRYLSAKWAINLPDNMVGDLDNHELFYKKVLFDCLQKKVYMKESAVVENNPVGIIPVDNVKYLNDYRIIYKNIENSRTLILNIYDKNID